MDIISIYLLCLYGMFMSALCMLIGHAVDSGLVILIGGAAFFTISVYRILRFRCPCCKRCMIFVPRRWDGRCPSCGTKIE